MNKGRIAVSAAIAGVAAALAVIGYFVLPETLTVQMSLTGNPGNTMQKLTALGAALLISLLGAALGYFSARRARGIIVGIAGIAVLILMFVFNL